jgi:hypothetical protein
MRGGVSGGADRWWWTCCYTTIYLHLKAPRFDAHGQVEADLLALEGDDAARAAEAAQLLDALALAALADAAAVAAAATAEEGGIAGGGEGGGARRAAGCGGGDYESAVEPLSEGDYETAVAWAG